MHDRGSAPSAATAAAIGQPQCVSGKHTIKTGVQTALMQGHSREPQLLVRWVPT